MAILALHLQDDFPRQYPLFATRTFTYKDETFRNHNTMLFHYAGTDGIKTGYTHASGFNLVASVHRGRKHVIGVIFGGSTAASRNAAMRTFLNMGLIKASSEKTRQPFQVARAPTTPENRITSVPTPHRVDRALAANASASGPTGPVDGSAQSSGRTPPYPVEIARVRAVQVQPRQPPSESGEVADSIAAMLSRTEVVADASAAPALMAPSGPSSPPMHLAPASADRPALMAEPALSRGSLPSTLGRQAANLARGEPALPAPAPQPAMRPSASSSSSLSAGDFQIQIGAFHSESEAERQLAAVRDRAGGLLAKASAVTQRVQQGDKLLYRARYAGFASQPAATGVCSELKRLKIDCLVMKAE
jgi:D-alanyl-D-alanine carboxypeptidase